MRVLSLLVLAAAHAKSDCETEVLRYDTLMGLAKQTYALYADMTTVVVTGLYKEGLTVAGPTNSKEINRQIDEAYLKAGEYYQQGMVVAAPFVAKAQLAATDGYATVFKLVAPHLSQLNTVLDRPLTQFSAALPMHAKLLAAPELADKAFLLMWLVFFLTLFLRLFMFAIRLTFKVVFLPFRLVCGRRSAAPTSGKKKAFNGKAQATNGNGKAVPAPKKNGK